MTCDEARERMGDYVDGALDEAAFQEMELHVAACAGCRAEERALRALLAHASALPAEMAPAHDLWTGIAERLDEPRPLWRRPRLLAGWGAGLAAAAGVVLALSAAFHGPGAWNVNTGLYKKIQFTERVALQLRAEVFNLFNHSNLFVDFGSPDVSSGNVLATRGLNTTSATLERRNVQLAAKFIF